MRFAQAYTRRAPLRPDLTRLIVCSRCTTVSRRCCSTCSRFTRRVQGRAMMSLVRALAERSRRRGGKKFVRELYGLNPFTVQYGLTNFLEFDFSPIFPFLFFLFFLIDNFFFPSFYFSINFFKKGEKKKETRFDVGNSNRSRTRFLSYLIDILN